MEFALPNQVKVEVFNQRKTILATVLDPKSFLGKFVTDNEEKLKEFKTKYQEFLDDVLSMVHSHDTFSGFGADGASITINII